ncbi:class I SAM-dependent methyltransferase [Haloterrigena alkaliphila]|uniref:Class I SAM-dependent methyltransferase n=1 Tax=Haloterrigena alkaliphila TaxID=2816475 RepID=A0A8A2VPK6_9EURY|nr:class I SAM-dependent methyltransferase [Haloterrigena alkaliphila]QSX00039.1 class I SAM-dependent methyltransferase [Haloterrigena alkaliphila]
MTRTQSDLKEQKEYFSSEELLEHYTSDATGGLSPEEREAITRYLPADGTRILDLGCGTGRTTTALERMGFDVVGVDFTESYIERARSLFPKPQFLVGDATTLPFDDEAFDGVVFLGLGFSTVLPEETRYTVLREIRRVLRPDKPVIFNTHNRLSTYVIREFSLEGVYEFLEFWAHNIWKKRLFSRYKSDTTVEDGPTDVYYIRPEYQKQQLRNCGFESVETVRPDGVLRSRFHHPHYIARKP